MQSYKRKITYFYQFHNGNIGSTAGFLKLEIRGEKVKIIVNIQEPPGLPYQKASLYFYHEAGDHLVAIKVDEIESVDGVLTYQERKDWQQLYDTGRDLYTFDGVAVMYNDHHYFIGDFKDKNRKDYKIVQKEEKKPLPSEEIKSFTELLSEAGKKKENEDMEKKYETSFATELTVEEEEKRIRREKKETEENETEEKRTPFIKDEEMKSAEDVFGKCEDCPYHKKREERKEGRDAFLEMLEEYPQLPMYGATELFQCVRIHPKDIGRLDMRNWKLGVNSFLTHGFYTYQYLLLGKMRFDDGKEHPILGVPGVFSNREKYLANMFGFEQFIPVKKTGIKTGEFGYWIVELQQ